MTEVNLVDVLAFAKYSDMEMPQLWAFFEGKMAMRYLRALRKRRTLRLYGHADAIRMLPATLSLEKKTIIKETLKKLYSKPDLIQPRRKK